MDVFMNVITFTGAADARLEAESFGAGRPVLLLHGIGQTRHAWRRTAELLAERGYRAVSVDLRGHGGSDWSNAGYGIPLYVEDLRRLVSLVGGAPALVGASMGGMISMAALGGNDPPPASALVIVDITTRIDMDGAKAIQAFMNANPDGFETVEQAAEAVAHYMPQRPRPRNASGLRRNLRERDGRLFWHWDPALMRHDASQADYDASSELLEAAVRNIWQPTLLVRGERSEIVSEEGVERLIDLIPHCEVAEVKGAGHMVTGDANTPFADALLEFLARVYPA
jgi:pimeloyl-ACP methyl ester carboxylesterase